MHGRNKPIALGQVGVRCIHCRDDPVSERGQQAVSYPSLITGIYNSVQQMLRLHFECCLSMPQEVREKIEALKKSSSARGGRKQYWVDSAKRLGLVDTAHGIHFARDPYAPLPPLGGPSGASSKDGKGNIYLSPGPGGKYEDESGIGHDGTGMNEDLGVTFDETGKKVDLNALGYLSKDEIYPLVVPEDKSLTPDYLYLTLQQTQPCNLMEADRVGCYRGRELGLPGLVR